MLTASGSKDWLIQRFTAIFLGFYTVFIFAYFLLHPQFSYEQWLALFSGRSIQLATLFALISVALHAWIGLWTVFTDYVHCLWLRYILQFVVVLTLAVYVVWGIFILWGN